MSKIAKAYGYKNVPITFTRKQVVKLIRMHSSSLEEFDAEYPVAESYDTDEVMAWLGY